MRSAEARPRWQSAWWALALAASSIGCAAASTPPTQAAKETPAMSGLEMPKPKRVGPPDVKPVQIGKLRFEAVHWGRERGFEQNGGVVAALDVASGKEQWTVVVYRIEYIPKLETDVQDLFIRTLVAAPDGKHLLVTDEKGRRFEVDIAARSARPAP
jgi:hypothetical protein